MANYTVTTTDDVIDPADGLLSLREALALADTDPATADTIDFAPAVQGGRIVLAGSQLTVGSDVTIDGGAGVTIDANHSSRVILVLSGTEVDPNELAIANLTVTGGLTSSELDGGGGIRVEGYSDLTATNITVSGNSTSGNGAQGGGISGSHVTLTNCTIADNSTTGGVHQGFHYQVYASGGGVSGTYLTLTNCTVTGNSATGDRAAGGGVSGRLLVANSIIAGNTGGGIGPDGSSGADVSGYTISNGLNIFGSDVSGSAPGDRENVPASTLFAGGLARNGGPTETIALLDDPANPALGRADPALAPETDQRGVARPAPEGTHPDIGAFELDQSQPISPPAAQTFTVTTTSDVSADDGALSLREALALANADSSTADRIEFAPKVQGQTILLAGGQLTIDSDISVDGGAGVTLDAGQASRVLLVQGLGTDAVLQHLTITGGLAGGPFESGGGIQALSETTLTLIQSAVVGNSANNFGGGVDGYSVTLLDSTISDNSANNFGGGIFVSGDSAITNCTVSGNSAGSGGGGISARADITVAGSLIANNTASFQGGGIQSHYGVTLDHSTLQGNRAIDGGGGGIYGSTVTIAYSTVADNSAVGDQVRGGGIYGSYVQLTNSTVSGNHAEGNYAAGGGIGARYTLTLTNSTVSGNHTTGDHAEGGGIAAYSSDPDRPATTLLSNSIIAGNIASGNGSSAPDFSSTMTTSNGHNIFGSDVVGSAPGDLELIPASRLFAGGLADNGGPTPTIALRDAPDNPALGGADPASAPATDQRGEVRPQPTGSAPDVGAFELHQTGGSGPNEIVCTARSEFLSGTHSSDLIRGLAGDDQLFGGAGRDVLAGQAGTDDMEGGSGADRFLFGSATDAPVGGPTYDEILDFHRAQHDRIDLRPIDARTGADGDQRFAFVGEHEFTQPGQLRYGSIASGEFLVSGNTDHDLDTELAFVVHTDAEHLRATDFLL